VKETNIRKENIEREEIKERKYTMVKGREGK